MNDLDILIIEKIQKEKQAEEEKRRIHLELPVYDDYYPARDNIKQIKEPKRVIVIDL